MQPHYFEVLIMLCALALTASYYAWTWLTTVTEEMTPNEFW